MKRIRTFVDASLLMAAARGTDEISDRAMAVLDDPRRSFVTSDFVRLELLPKAVFHRQREETRFYLAFFAGVRAVRSSSALVSVAQTEAELTAEKPGKPLFRVRGLTVVTIRPGAAG